VAASDIEVQADPGVRVAQVFLEKAAKRVRFHGGNYGQIEMQIPMDFTVIPSVPHEDWLIQDVLFDDVEVDSTGSAEYPTAFLLRGKRIAIVRSRLRARHYSVWVGDTGDFPSEDIILAGNTFDSAGPEATVRLQPILRAAVVDNRMTNTSKHNYRVHGRSDLAFAARNTLINAGVMLATQPGDELGTIWLQDNVFHHTLPSLLDLDHPLGSVLRRFIATGNTIYTGVWECFVCDTPPRDWKVGSNSILPYRPFVADPVG
jgi:hypothetical protein